MKNKFGLGMRLTLSSSKAGRWLERAIAGLEVAAASGHRSPGLPLTSPLPVRNCFSRKKPRVPFSVGADHLCSFLSLPIAP